MTALASSSVATAPSGTLTGPVAADPLPTLPEHNRTGIHYRRPMPRPAVRGRVVDAHCHLLAQRHADLWFEAADHFGIDTFFTMSPLEEVLTLQRRYGHRLHFIAVPNWYALAEADIFERWHRALESFHNLGSRIAKLHMAPGTMKRASYSFDDDRIRGILSSIRDRGMAIMTHVGDPETWYVGKYQSDPTFGTRAHHYAAWERALEDYRGTPWLGAHLGGNPEDLGRLQTLLDRFPDLMLDLSATRWMVREVSARRDEARDFILRNQNRLLWGSDQVSADNRDWDFFASRWWCHRKLWETAYHDTTPIFDPDCPLDAQPKLSGLALPDSVLQKLYRDNAVKFLYRVGITLP
jgi:Amidohydrolase